MNIRRIIAPTACLTLLLAITIACRRPGPDSEPKTPPNTPIPKIEPKEPDSKPPPSLPLPIGDAG